MRENLRGSMAREDIYKVARVLSRNQSRARLRAQRHSPSTPLPTLPFLRLITLKYYKAKALKLLYLLHVVATWQLYYMKS